MRRGAIVRVVTIALLAAAVATAVALFIPWLPPLRSEQGERIDFVLWFTVAICIAVFAVVAAITVYSVAKFRVRPDDDSDGPPIHGHTGIEIAWTAIPTILVTVIAVVSAVALAENGKLKDDRVVIEVTARQFAWTFAYPTDAEAVAAAKDEQICKLPPETPNCPVSGTLRLPEGRQVELRLRALDVIHSFWVPEFRQKQDAVPGIVTRRRDHADSARRAHRRVHRALRSRPRLHASRGDRDEGGRVRPLAFTARARSTGKPGIR